MNRFVLAAAAAALTLAGSACASGSSKQKGVGIAPAGGMYWTGNIRPMEQRTGAATPVSPAAMFEGTVLMMGSREDSTRTTIHIRLSTPTNGGSVSWILSSGRCGNFMNPVLPVTAFDPLDVGSNGSVDETTTIPLQFPTDGSFHVDILAGHTARLTEVIACANLSLKEP